MKNNSGFDFEVTDQSVSKFCQQLLKRRFPSEPIKQSINDSDPDKLNFACPYCGDSQNDPNKKRGNVYLKTQSYKCYNDGCAIWQPLVEFVSYFSLRYSLSVPTVERPKPEFRPKTSSRKKGYLIEFLINKEVGTKLLDFKSIAERFSLSRCAEADPLSPIGQYISNRKLNQLPVFEQSCYYDSRHDKVYIFNLDLKSGKMLGFAIRKINDSSPGPKYNIKNYSEFKKVGLVEDLEDEFIEKVDSINNYFNIMNVDFSKEVTVTEGQIDTMFVKNCVATTGVTKSKALFSSLLSKAKSRILFDNDKAGRDQSIEFLKKGYRVFLWTKLTYALKLKYPADRLEIRKIKDVNDLYKFLVAREPDLDFNGFNTLLDHYFSDSAFDLLLV